MTWGGHTSDQPNFRDFIREVRCTAFPGAITDDDEHNRTRTYRQTQIYTKRSESDTMVIANANCPKLRDSASALASLGGSDKLRPGPLGTGL
jgi:hypothetical protein